MECSTRGFPVHQPNIRDYWNLCLLYQWWHPVISFSVIPFSSCFQTFPTSGAFPRSWFFTSGGQSIEVSASTSVLPKNIQDWFHLGLIGWISLQSKGASRVMFIDMIIWFLSICLLMWYITLINLHILKTPTSLREIPLDHDVNPFHKLSLLVFCGEFCLYLNQWC